MARRGGPSKWEEGRAGSSEISYAYRGASVVAHAKGQEVGRLEVELHDSRMSVGWIHVDPAYQRLGIATTMYEMAAAWAAEYGLPLTSDASLSPESRGFWRKQEAKGRAKWVPTPWSDRHHEQGRYWLDYPPPKDLSRFQGLVTRHGETDFDVPVDAYSIRTVGIDLGQGITPLARRIFDRWPDVDFVNDIFNRCPPDIVHQPLVFSVDYWSQALGHQTIRADTEISWRYYRTNTHNWHITMRMPPGELMLDLERPRRISDQDVTNAVPILGCTQPGNPDYGIYLVLLEEEQAHALAVWLDMAHEQGRF